VSLLWGRWLADEAVGGWAFVLFNLLRGFGRETEIKTIQTD
jgi:hypothetical protein